MSYYNPEPPFDDDDTSPSMPVVKPEKSLGWLWLLGAFLFSSATLAVLLWPAKPEPAPIIVESPSLPTESLVAIESIPVSESLAIPSSLPPIVQAEQVSILLQSPFSDETFMSYRYDAFTTINNERPRSGFVDYVAVSGDTLESIASRYGLQSESIAWCNDRRIIQVLRPNDTVRIPPVDGACHRVLGTLEESIASIAANYKIEDPYAIIDSSYNYGQLPSGVRPDDILPGGVSLFIPNGQGPVISWNAASTETDANGNVVSVSFGAGERGTCGNISPNGGSYWGNPLPNGTWVRGFSAAHPALDLAAPTGTPIYAANSGQVIFSGVSRWGYGEAVVIEHGGVLSTLYGHMSQRNVDCGQSVVTGQVIGYVGSTGVSTGPHLHFEIQINGQAIDPSGTPGIGW